MNYLFLHGAERAQQVGLFCSYSSTICSSLSLYNSSLLVCSSLSQGCLPVGGKHHWFHPFFCGGDSFNPQATQAASIRLSAPFFKQEPEAPKLKLFTKVSPARLTTGLYPQPPPLLASLKSPPSQIEAMSPMIQSRGQDQTISVPKIKSHKQIKYMFALSKCV